jgi:Gas vesicle protein G
VGLITGLLTLPIAPVRGVAWIAERVAEQAERELYDESAIRRQLVEAEFARDSGELGDEEFAYLEEELLGRLAAARAYTRGGGERG